MDPLTVLAFARDLGRVPDEVLLLCCEPAAVPVGEPGENVLLGLSAPVRAALVEAERKAIELVSEALAQGRAAHGTGDERVHEAEGPRESRESRGRGKRRGGETA